MLRKATRVARRVFLKTGSAGAAAAAAGWSVHARAEQQPAEDASASSRVETNGPVYRTLGRTGMKVAVIGIGTDRAQDPAVLRYAIDRGVNYIDTARIYRRGRSEEHIGKAIKGMRDKVFVTTKFEPESKDVMRRHTEESLRALQTDYVDVLMAHGLNSRERVMNEEVKEVLAEARSQGKARFVGFSAHRMACLDAAATDPDKFYDVVMVRYNFKSSKDETEAIARAARAGIGFVAMKTQARARWGGGGSGGYDTKELGDISPDQAALKWVLLNPHVSTTVPTMINLDMINENTEVMGMKFSTVDKQILSRYDAFISPYYCHGCGACDGTCPKGVIVPEVNRCLMYAQGYGDMELARSEYARLPRELTAAACSDCAECTVRCANGLEIARNMRLAQRMFA